MTRTAPRFFFLFGIVGPSVASCAPEPRDRERVHVEVWAHAGQSDERAVLEDQARRFNAMHDSIEVELAFIPEGAYNAQVQASAVAGRLPDLLDLDGPYVAQYAWQGHLRSLNDLLPDSTIESLLPSVVEQGSWRDRLYAVGTFDSGLGLYASRSALRSVNARIPTSPQEAWTADELTGLLGELRQGDPDGAVLDLKLNFEGEWYAYAFQPVLRSAGGGLLDIRDGRPFATGILDGPSSLDALQTLQSWITGGFVDPNLDDAAFTDRRVALSWSGHWDFPRYREAMGDDLVVLPLPDFGRGSRTGQGSWMWAVPRGGSNEAEVSAFLGFLLRTDEILRMAEANGAVPGSVRAADESERYGPAGPLRLLLEQLEGGWAVPRPRTPAYPFVSSVFQDVFRAVRNGEPLRPVVDRAAHTIDREVRDNRGYPDS